MSELLVNTIKKADGTGSLTVPAESGTVVTTASPSLGRRNLIINGAMQVAQRGTSFTGVTTGQYTLDRWRVNLGPVDQYVCTVTQESNGTDGFSKSLKIQTTTAETAFESGDSVDIEQRVEAQDLQHLKWGTSDAQSLTLSFWCKCNKTGTQSIHVRAHDADHGYSTGYTINAADTWEYKTVTISGNTTGSITDDNSIGIWIRWQLADGNTASVEDAWDTVNTGPYAVSGAMEWGTSTSDYFQITGVQLEVGSVATPFEHRSFGEELALCQRYCFRMNSNRIASGTVGSSTEAFFVTHLPVSMRATPSLIVNALGNIVKEGTAWYANTAISVSGSGTSPLALSTTQSNNQMSALHSTALGNGVDLTFDAEL